MTSSLHRQDRTSAVLMVFLFLLLLVPATASADADTMDFLAPQPTGNTINDVWSPDGTNFYFAGDGGTILHYDGTDFTVMPTPTFHAIYGIYGTSANNIWAVGGCEYGYQATEQGRSVILHYDGNSWTSVTPPKDSVNQYYVFKDVWVDPAGVVYAVAESNGIVAKRSGGTWSIVDTGIVTNFGYHGVYGFAANDVYVVGDCGFVIHWNGTAWTKEREQDGGCGQMSTDILYAVWGPDNANVFAVGNSGQIIKRQPDGSWNTLYAGGWFDTSLTGISGTSADDMYFSGYADTLVHWDGTDRTALDFGSGISQNCIIKKNDTTYYLGMELGNISRFNGATRTQITTESPSLTRWGRIQRTDRTWLSPSELDSDVEINSWDGKNFNAFNPGFSGQLRVMAFRAHSSKDIMISGEYITQGGCETRRYNGSTWQSDGACTSALLDEVKSGSTTAQILAGSWDEDMGTYRGLPCVGENCVESTDYVSLATATDGTIYTVGKGGAIAAYRNGSWTTENSGTSNDLLYVAAGGGKVCAVGRSRTIVWKNDGGAWQTTNLSTLAENAFVGVAHAGSGTFVAALNTGNDGSSSYTGADKGTLYKVDSGTATLVRGGMSISITGIASDSAGNVIATGGNRISVGGGVLYGNELTTVNEFNIAPLQLLLLGD